ncbi:MAG: hypothetical protein ACREX1_22670, partial [Advenella sp.]
MREHILVRRKSTIPGYVFVPADIFGAGKKKVLHQEAPLTSVSKGRGKRRSRNGRIRTYVKDRDERIMVFSQTVHGEVPAVSS